MRVAKAETSAESALQHRLLPTPAPITAAFIMDSVAQTPPYAKFVTP